jgi:beta-lactamase regulating signal transducer with metallopeptidase domain
VDTLLRAGLSNAAAACALALVAAAVGYFCRRPAVRHALWLLVLLKLVTPPLVELPIPRPSAPEPPAAVAEAPPPAPEELPALAPEADPDPPAEVVVEVVPVAEPPFEAALEIPEPEQPEEPVVPAAVPEPPPAPPSPPFPWQAIGLAAWAAGSVFWLGLTAWRAGRFARLLCYARPAPDWLRREADRLARRLGLARAPGVWLVPGRVSPMVWAAGWSPLLLLPGQLMDRLDADARRTLLAHELAHLLRRDHRVRLFELLVTALFWWHPVVWWARRELREAEEQCCDAWVLWALPESAKTYALALVETVDFLSEAPSALPALASGVGQVHDLRRRVTMIMQGTTPRALTWGGVLALFGLGAFLLPVMPSWAQEAEQPRRVREVAPDDSKAQPDLKRIEAELEKKRAELMKLEAELKDAMKRAAAQEAPKQPQQPLIIEVVGGDGVRQTIKLPPGTRVISAQTDKGADAKREADFVARMAELKKKLDADRAKAGQARGLVIVVISDGKEQVIELPPGSRVISSEEMERNRFRVVRPGELPKAGQPEQPGRPVEIKREDARWRVVDPRAVDTDKRLSDLERRLEELMRAVKELRGEMQKGKPLPAIPGRTGVDLNNLEIEVRPEVIRRLKDIEIEVRPENVKPGDKAPSPRR